ncbi:unnamed protein product, partial [Mesorhabditis belari]|uniref:Uncharacterized protein n=1 Tax=Mesorhabditis belari TaxID=2138241 RepID=A0AAF3EWT2_9BILA
MIPLLILLNLCLGDELETFSLDTVEPQSLGPALKPVFLINATPEAVEQFMGIAHTAGLTQHRKAVELDVLVGTLRPEVQAAFQTYKAEALMLKLAQDERYTDAVAKAHYVIAHLNALKSSRNIGDNEKKKRTEMIFAEFTTFLVDAITEEVSNVVENMMRMMLRAVLFTEKWGS